MGCSERQKEIRRRRKRREKINQYRSKLGKASASEKVEIARKLREMTPGSEVLIENWKLVDSDR